MRDTGWSIHVGCGFSYKASMFLHLNLHPPTTLQSIYQATRQFGINIHWLELNEWFCKYLPQHWLCNEFFPQRNTCANANVRVCGTFLFSAHCSSSLSPALRPQQSLVGQQKQYLAQKTSHGNQQPTVGAKKSATQCSRACTTARCAVAELYDIWVLLLCHSK